MTEMKLLKIKHDILGMKNTLACMDSRLDLAGKKSVTVKTA